MIDYAVITGGSSGIVQAVALRLASLGIPVLLVGRAATAGKTCDLITEHGGRAELFFCNIADYAQFQSSLTQVIAERGPQRLGVVLAASVLGQPGASCPIADYEQVYRVNVVGNLAVLQACLPQMSRSHFGRGLFFAGGGAAYAYPAFPAYALSKVSTVRLVENLAAEYPAAKGFSFVCLAPGAVDTPMLAKVVAAGGQVKTKTDISEPVGFAEGYFRSESTALHGRYIHVRDEWAALLDGAKQAGNNHFYLRRIE